MESLKGTWSTVLITALGSWGQLVPHGHSCRVNCDRICCDLKLFGVISGYSGVVSSSWAHLASGVHPHAMLLKDVLHMCFPRHPTHPKKRTLAFVL
jgi:hypothetical protein